MRQKFISTKSGDVTGNSIMDTVTLYGSYPYDNKDYIKNLELIVSNNAFNDTLRIKLNVSGYYFKLCLHDFTGNGKKDILIRGETGGYKSYALAFLYEVVNNTLVKIFDVNMFYEQYNFTAKYLREFKVEILSPKTDKRFLIDISNNDIEYLYLLYDINGTVKSGDKPIISYPNAIYAINNVSKDYYCIIIEQRILGVSSTHILGSIQTIIRLNNSTINVVSQDLLTKGENYYDNDSRIENTLEIEHTLPLQSQLLSFHRINADYNSIIKLDLTRDNSSIYLCIYKNGDNIYLGAFKKINDKFKLIDSYKGHGYDISDFIIAPIKTPHINNIIIGWKISANWSLLDILEIKNNKFLSILHDKNIKYSKIHVKNMGNDKDGLNEIVLWSHDTGEAYDIEIYKFKKNKFKKITDYDKYYYNDVIKYYKDLLKLAPNSVIYMYYLALSQYKIGDFKSALETVNKSLGTFNPYPNKNQLIKLKNKIKSQL